MGNMTSLSKVQLPANTYNYLQSGPTRKIGTDGSFSYHKAGEGQVYRNDKQDVNNTADSVSIGDAPAPASSKITSNGAIHQNTTVPGPKDPLAALPTEYKDDAQILTVHGQFKIDPKRTRANQQTNGQIAYKGQHDPYRENKGLAREQEVTGLLERNLRTHAHDVTKYVDWNGVRAEALAKGDKFTAYYSGLRNLGQGDTVITVNKDLLEGKLGLTPEEAAAVMKDPRFASGSTQMTVNEFVSHVVANADKFGDKFKENKELLQAFGVVELKNAGKIEQAKQLAAMDIRGMEKIQSDQDFQQTLALLKQILEGYWALYQALIYSSNVRGSPVK